ncbi:SIS domain-containing protein [Gaiella sp.]|uniref:SIS domain-containing protein n=1 Tax=Gaiella sp. TaxID=2663207 RepID=UPI003266E793
MSPEGFLADVLSAPARLERVLDDYGGPGSPLAAVETGGVGRVLFLGMGSSRFAALAAVAHLRARGIDAYAELASTGLATLPRAGTLVVGISASGGTLETIEALARHRGTSPTVALTNRPHSAIENVADLTLPLLAGEEEGGVACVSFQATLAVLFLLCKRLAGGAGVDALRPAVAAADTIRSTRAEWLDELVDLVVDRHTVYAVAPAERISSALQSALMLREGPRIAADATETGDWLHVDVYLSKHPGYTALLFPGSRFDAGVMDWARERASSVIAVGAAVDGAALHIPYPTSDSAIVATLVETGIAELLAAELWRRQISS